MLSPVLISLPLLLSSSTWAREPIEKRVNVALAPFLLFNDTQRLLGPVGGDRFDNRTMAEATVELRRSERGSVAIVMGIGEWSDSTVFSNSAEDQGDSTIAKSSTWGVELGFQPRYYLLGDFDAGLDIGGTALFRTLNDRQELTYQGAPTGEEYEPGAHTSVEVSDYNETSLLVGPQIGAKYTFPFGLLVDGQIGYGYSVGRNRYQAGEEDIEAKDSGFEPFVNLNLGWAFGTW